MVLNAFWGSLGRLLGALGGFLEGSWELFGASRLTKKGLQIRFGTPLGVICLLLAAEDSPEHVLGPFRARIWCSQWPFGGCFRTRRTDFDIQN